MWCKNLNRTEFVDLVGNLEQRNPVGFGARHGAPSIQPEKQALWALWANDPADKADFPNIIVVSDAELIDFLAWTATFLTGFRPFSSFFRVLSWSVFQELEKHHFEPELRGFASRSAFRQGEADLDDLEDVCVALALCETLTNTQTRASFESLAIQAFASTYSFVMARGLALGLPNALLDRIAEKWETARELTDQPVRKLTLQHLNAVWGVVRGLKGDISTNMSSQDDIVLRACRELQQHKQITYFTWNDLAEGRIDLENTRQVMSERKEQRVRLFEKLVGDIPNGDVALAQSSFICGFLASLVSESNLDHADLVFPVLEKFPTALLWYGVCIGLSPKSRLQSYKNGLGRRLLRDILRSEQLFSRPYADLAIEELEVFSNSDNEQAKIHQRSSTSLSVEIAPMVTVSLKPPSRRVETTSPQLFPKDDLEATVSVLKELGSALDKAVSIQRAVIGHLEREKRPPAEEPPRTKKRRKGWRAY